MPTVTALKPQKRHPDRVSLFVDGVFVGGLAAELAADLGLEEGAEVGAADLAAAHAADELERAFRRMLIFLRVRPRSRAEFERRLRRYGYDEDVRAAVLELLAAKGLIDDGRFARAWVRDRAALKPKGRRLLAAELRAKGVAAGEAEAALAEELDFSEEEMARRALGRRADYYRAKGEVKGRAALYGFLARRGFAGAVARKLTDEVFRTRASVNACES